MAARHGQALGEVVLAASAPLDLTEVETPNKQIDDEPEVEALVASVARPRGRGARLVVRPQERIVLTASGAPIPGAWAAISTRLRR